MRKSHLLTATIGFLLSTSLTWAQAQPSTPDPCKSASEFATTDCTLTWHGITVYGAYDIGVGWVSHGLPENGYNYEGASLVNRNGYEHRFLIAPNNLQQTGLGIKGKEEFLPGWSVVFNASTGINPQSGLLANASATDIVNNNSTISNRDNSSTTSNRDNSSTTSNRDNSSTTNHRDNNSTNNNK